MSGRERRIVVGVDGSPSSVQALIWAVRQAGFTGSVVDAITAWQYPVSYGWAVTDLDPQLSELAAESLAKAVEQARSVNENVEIRTHVLEQNPARALIDAAEGADLLVVGSRGHGGFVGALIGSVSQHCIHHAPCSVVVIRDGTD